MLLQKAVELSRALDVGEMGRLAEHLEAGARDACGEQLRLLPRGRGILRAGHDERRRLDVLELLAHVPTRDRLAAARVPLTVGRKEHLAVASDVSEATREPAAEDCVGDRLNAVRAHGRRAFEPCLRLAEPRRGARERELVDALRGVDCDSHSYRAAE